VTKPCLPDALVAEIKRLLAGSADREDGRAGTSRKRT
jgi:hypothetical protein